MKVNVGGTDRMIRAVIGLALIGMTLQGYIGVWGWVGVILLATAVFSFCPAYRLFGIKTCNTD